MNVQERLEKMLRDDLWETDDWGTPGPDDVAEYLSPIIEGLLEALKDFQAGMTRPDYYQASVKARAAIAKVEG